MRKLSTIALAVALLALSASSVSAAPVLEMQVENDPLADEIQKVTVKATGGQYRLNFGEGGPGVSQTADIAFNASAAEMATALNAITNVSNGGGSVSITGGPGNELGTLPYRVVFSGGPLQISDVPEMTVSPGTTPLSGGSELVAIRTTIAGGISRGDLRHDFTVKVRNTAAASANAEVGDTLGCSGAKPNKNWSPTGETTRPASFGFQWRRNGAVIPGEDKPAYVATAADAGTVVQCLVTGFSNASSTKPSAATYASLPVTVVDPQPAIEPPKPESATVAGSRPTVTGTGAAERTCAAPANWLPKAPSPDVPTYTFQWLRNGVEIPGATTNKYTPVLSTDEGSILQCRVIGTNGGGSTVGISNNSNVLTVSNAPTLAVGETPTVVIDATSPVIELELPAGQESFLQKISVAELSAENNYWSCAPVPSSQPKRVACTDRNVLAPGAQAPTITLSVGLGADAPDLSEVEVSAAGVGAAPVSTVFPLSIGPAKPFGITAFETQVPDPQGNEETQAGAHPIQAKAEFSFNRYRSYGNYFSQFPGEFPIPSTPIGHHAPVEHTKHLNIHTPRGFVGNALAVPELCPTVKDVLAAQCPKSSIVGGIDISFIGVGLRKAPIYSVKPEYGTPAQFAFPATSVKGVYTFYPELRADDSYAISLISAPVPMNPALLDVNAVLCGFGAKTLPSGNELQFDGCKQPGEPDPDGPGPRTAANPTPLITLPTRCAGRPPFTTLEIDSWQSPGNPKTREFEAKPITGCEKVDFQPSAEIKPTSQQADSPTGLDVELTMPTNGLEGKDPEGNLDPEALAQANMKMTRVTFPEGMAINPSAGQGLGSCSNAQVGLGTNDPISCPDSSKIGTIEIDTPILQETLTGAMYIGKQSEAPEGALIGLHLVFESKKDGIIVKIPGEVKTNPKTGQLVATFDEILEDPFSRVKISFNQGPRSSLLNPPRCGTYAVKTEMVPWTIKDLDNPDPSEIVTQSTSFEITEGPDGGPCPNGALEAKLDAGTTNPLAGQSTAFEMGISRPNGSQRINGLEMTLPPGILGVLKGVPYCPEAAIQEAISRNDVEEGQLEIDSPACPEASRIGSVTAGAGGGPNPIYVDTGKAYLGGPYKGAPLSLVVIAPAVAGPLDLGTVVVRNQLRIDRRTTAISAIADPIPTILHGVLLDIRDVRLTIDRPNFILNPTNCEQMGFNGEVSGESGAKAPVSDRFQLSGCENLGFKPKLSIKLIGGTKRGDHPSLLASLKARPGDANIARAAVTLPPSAFLDQAHIRTICTRVQFAAETCPKGAIYGATQATTPLLEETLQGNVILRSSDNKLPDLVGTLNGIATVDVVGRIDSVRGGLRSTFDVIPDAPVSTFELRMQGGNKGLVINSKDLCATRNRATVKFTAQNGRQYNTRPLVIPTNCKKAKKRKAKKNRGAANSR